MHRIALHENETLLSSYHQSFYVLLGPIALALAVIAVPWYYLARYGIAGEFYRLLLFWALIVLALLGRKLVVWWLNLYSITNQRLIKISHEGLFKKLMVETPLERILNVSFKTTGFWSSMLKFGDVEVQVVGLMEPMILAHINEPAEIKDYLWQLHQTKSAGPHSFKTEEIPEVQEHIGYTKQNQKIL